MSSNSRGFPFLEVAATVTAMSKFAAADTLEMPVAERLQLVEDIWDTIAENPRTTGCSTKTCGASSPDGFRTRCSSSWKATASK